MGSDWGFENNRNERTPLRGESPTIRPENAADTTLQEVIERSPLKGVTSIPREAAERFENARRTYFSTYAEEARKGGGQLSDEQIKDRVGRGVLDEYEQLNRGLDQYLKDEPAVQMQLMIDMIRPKLALGKMSNEPTIGMSHDDLAIPAFTGRASAPVEKAGMLEEVVPEEVAQEKKSVEKIINASPISGKEGIDATLAANFNAARLTYFQEYQLLREEGGGRLVYESIPRLSQAAQPYYTLRAEIFNALHALPARTVEPGEIAYDASGHIWNMLANDEYVNREKITEAAMTKPKKEVLKKAKKSWKNSNVRRGLLFMAALAAFVTSSSPKHERSATSPMPAYDDSATDPDALGTNALRDEAKPIPRISGLPGVDMSADKPDNGMIRMPNKEERENINGNLALGKRLVRESARVVVKKPVAEQAPIPASDEKTALYNLLQAEGDSHTPTDLSRMSLEELQQIVEQHKQLP